jgi:transcriptional regulator with XRE-family HTH domain
MKTFGTYVREKREKLFEKQKEYSVRKLAGRVGLEPSYLSKIEREVFQPPSEEKIIALAKEIGEDPDIMLAMAGKISGDLAVIIRKRPALFAELIRSLKSLPDNAVLRIVREVRDGDW